VNFVVNFLRTIGKSAFDKVHDEVHDEGREELILRWDGTSSSSFTEVSSLFEKVQFQQQSSNRRAGSKA
jgi:hypothetical protein